MPDTLSIALVGAGYWGPNLARNLRNSSDWNLVAICDLDSDRAQRVAQSVGPVSVFTALADVLALPGLDAIAIATPAHTHHSIALQALKAGKHVLVEKPLADSRAHGLEMVQTASELDLILMADHTYCYTPAVLKMRELIADGSLGDILFVDAVRINLGLIQPDVDVFWDLAPHDLSILDFILPGGLQPDAISAQGFDPLGAGSSCVGYLTIPLNGGPVEAGAKPIRPQGAVAQIHINWLSPTKIRRMVIGGSRRTLVWDDLNPSQRLSIFDRGVDLGGHSADSHSAESPSRRASAISYRLGDTWSPALAEREPLADMVTEFAASIRQHRAPRTDGNAALRVLSVLEAVRESLANNGARTAVSHSVDAELEVAA
ncbi:MAG: oxidoreductase [Subtercola sp.]|nr:oxidoreductase [Subtercola sp.]